MNTYEVFFEDGSSIQIEADTERDAYSKASKFSVASDIETIELVFNDGEINSIEDNGV